MRGASRRFKEKELLGRYSITFKRIFAVFEIWNADVLISSEAARRRFPHVSYLFNKIK